MNGLLRYTQQEVKRIQQKQAQSFNEDVAVYLNWGRNGKKELQLLTVIKNVPKQITRNLYKSNWEE